MNMQKILQEAQKMQAQLQKDQKELEATIYEGVSSIVSVKMNGKYEVISVDLNLTDDITVDDKDMLEDMIQVAVNDAVKKYQVLRKRKWEDTAKDWQGLCSYVSE